MQQLILLWQIYDKLCTPVVVASIFDDWIIWSSRLCLGAWTDHGERTGGFYACNRYEAAKQEGVVMEPVIMWLVIRV